jgi:endogenous inhibitor of DNA gyrase (YacG/DUF329 family)
VKGENRKDNSEPEPRCRYCGRKVATDSPEWNRHQPFCSHRCRLADLDCWLDEEYRIPGNAPDEEENADPAKEAEDN